MYVSCDFNLSKKIDAGVSAIEIYTKLPLILNKVKDRFSYKCSTVNTS